MYNNVNGSAKRVVLRRLQEFPQLKQYEKLLLMAGNVSVDTGAVSGGAVCALRSWVEGEVCFYSIELPASWQIIPANWKRFAYDHDKIKALLLDCIKDNVQELSFAPWSGIVKLQLENTLHTALGDLSSVFDTGTVACEQDSPEKIVVRVEGEHKNGERMTYFFEFSAP